LVAAAGVVLLAAVAVQAAIVRLFRGSLRAAVHLPSLRLLLLRRLTRSPLVLAVTAQRRPRVEMGQMAATLSLAQSLRLEAEAAVAVREQVVLEDRVAALVVTTATQTAAGTELPSKASGAAVSSPKPRQAVAAAVAQRKSALQTTQGDKPEI
jgi:hypothetical protein